jgi:hypothetical protein
MVDTLPVLCRNSIVMIRRTAPIAAALVALVVAVAVPMSQLRTFVTITKCCCPDPSECHCPKDKAPLDGAPSMSTCHHQDSAVVSPEAPALVFATIPQMTPAPRAVASLPTTTSSPHPAPDPRRPAAPS